MGNFTDSLSQAMLAGTMLVGGLGIRIYNPQSGVQWKQGLVVHIILYTVLLYNTTPIRCTPLRLHPPLMNTQ